MSKRLPLIAIVGRPNVGKSALFNRIVNQKIAIVDEAEGITRDRLYARAELFGRPFEVVDTGGIDAKSEALFNEQIREQALIAIEEADALIMVVDAKIGVTKLDNDVAQILLKTKKPLALAVNKVDSEHQDNLLAPFYSLGIEAVIGVSAVQGRHLAEILESVVYKLPEPEEIQDEGRIQVAFIGRPNVGKSTLTNALLGEERCIVSPIAGTTRDSIDIKFSYDGQDYTLIDTAGVRRKNSEKEVVDKFAAIRTKRAIERADVCVLLLDSQEGMTAQEKTIANMIEEAGKGCIMIFNKWDLVKGFRMEHCMKAIRDEVPFMAYCPGLFISALSGRNIDQILPLVKEVYEQCTRRISTGELNRFFIEAMQLTPAPRIDGKRLRIYYAAQVATGPARFILFINHPDLMMDSYERYLMNRFREKFGFKGAPVIFSRRGRAETDREHKKRPALANPAHHHHHQHATHDDEVFAED